MLKNTGWVFPTIATLISAIASVGAFADGNAEVHCICIRRPFSTGPTSSDAVDVFLDRPGKSVILVCCSEDAARWRVRLSAKTTLTKVILGGRSAQSIENEQGLRIDEWFLDRPNVDSFLDSAYSIAQPSFRPFVSKVHERTHLEISSYTGMESALKGQPVVVDAVQNEPRLLTTFPQPDWRGPLPKLQFSAVDNYPINERENQASYGPFTLTGPITKEHISVPAPVVRIAGLPENGEFVGLDDHNLFFLDRQMRITEKIKLADSPAKISFLSDIAFDLQSRRVFVLAKDGTIVSLDPKSREWKTELPNSHESRWAAFALHPDGHVYALCIPFSAEKRAHIAVLNRNGKEVKQVTLGDAFFPGVVAEEHRKSAQIRLVGKYAIIVTGPSAYNLRKGINRIVYHYLVDLDKGTTYLVWRSA